ncbi:VWA domain-containing protein [Nocardia sp. CA-290969]|uniref:VWA domain-containing protein n=1 Tax=Nocardia sp. CA-290969 TaxID=3239986 RepID=UPI003D8F1502
MKLFGRTSGTATQQQPTRSVTLTKSAGPAVSRDIVAGAGVDLAKKFDKAGVSLSKAGMDGIRAEAVLVLDHSGSMFSDYRTGSVQVVVDRALAFALQIDVDGKIPVIPFDSQVWPTIEVSLTNYSGVVDRDIFRPSRMGATYLGRALEQVLEMAKTTRSPLYVVIVTDDDPTDADRVVRILNELRGYPVFVKVLTLVRAPFWDQQDNLRAPGLIDNIDAKRITKITGMSDLAFADVMVDEWPSWVQAATAAGILV